MNAESADATQESGHHDKDVARVALTPAAVELLSNLIDANGAVMFHQSGGCCDGSAPMCYPVGMFRTGQADVLLATLPIPDRPAVEFWMAKFQFELWQHTHLTVDVVDGRGSGFSLEAPEGKRFLVRSRIFTDEEWASLEARPVVS
ncbi:DUF779 domain-containing protein [Humidisolicoccus flavus]|uniref:DUF779 domain-containing protein n=1 Tax=Humidisolicoccus flavus TaxID=3111414 RepID=UPI003248A168